jgi:hypothetical protein
MEVEYKNTYIVREIESQEREHRGLRRSSSME